MAFGEREFPQAGGHVAAATLTGDHEGFAASGRWEHGDIIGEDEAKIVWRSCGYRERDFGTDRSEVLCPNSALRGLLKPFLIPKAS